MLDECKGEKFFEILAFFSNLVVKKILVPRNRRDRNVAVALDLSTAPTLSMEKQRSLIPLTIAHHSSLTALLKTKEEKRRRYIEFEQLLNTKAEDINQRIRKSKGTPSSKKSVKSQKEVESVKKQLKENWVGDQKWLDVLLRGDNAQNGDGFLNNRFERVWQNVEAGKDLGHAASGSGLLQNLQQRVEEQQERLEKWKKFSEELQRNAFQVKEKTKKPSSSIKQFTFDDHLQYQLPNAKQMTEEMSTKEMSLRTEYQQILTDLDSELLRISKHGGNQAFGASLRRRRSSASAPRSPARSRRVSRSDSIPQVPVSPTRTMKLNPQTKKPSLENVPVLPKPRYVAQSAIPLDSEATLVGHPSTLRRSSIEREPLHRPDPEPTPPSSDPVTETPSTLPTNTGFGQAVQKSPSLSPEPEPSSIYPSEPPILLEPPELTAEEALAEQIITSIGEATPSPVKKPPPRMSLSLAERTRMSMARTTSFESVPESPELPLSTMPPPPPPPIEEEVDRRATLLERTRLSMVAMQNKPRVSMSARENKEKRKSRQSLFPVNQFDTPRNRKSFERLEELRATQGTPKEELLSDETDYDRIFKSRPKIATSPVFTPHQLDGFEDDESGEDEYADDVEVTGIDLGDVDQDEDEDGFTKSWADSPSRRAGGVRVRY